ncbi:hypothetical protein CXB51_026339 [Gossypium anomalum]|uniref:RNase H type-1 domain-containing protein n=1 Tax=Gossypium anomalum TaxID=47600 RepID=A0A8J6CT52_9ROSI|nr:hypothetical protein CXB51_026339 [Gossypium anomalum]
MGFMQVILASDSKMPMKNITSPGEDNLEKRPVTSDVKASVRNFSNCRFEYTMRQGNSLAHALVEEAIRRLEDCF